MKIAAITENSTHNCNPRRNSFIKYSNSFMSSPLNEEPQTQTQPQTEPVEQTSKKGIETLEQFSIFPKKVINGQTFITA